MVATQLRELVQTLEFESETRQGMSAMRFAELANTIGGIAERLL